MLKTILKESLKYKGLFILVNLLLMVIYACEMIIPYMFTNFIDIVTETKLLVSMKVPIVVISITLIILLLSSYIKDIFSEYLITKINNNFLNQLDKKLEHIPYGEVQKHSPAYLNQRLFNDIITSVTFVHENFSVAIIMLISTIILLFLIAITQKTMLIVVGIAILINTIGILLFNKLMYKRGYEFRDLHSLYHSSNIDRLASIKETKIHSWYEISDQAVNRHFNELLKKGVNLYKVIASLNNIGILSKNITLILTILFGGYLFTSGDISIGQLILVTTYTNICLSNTEFFLKLGQQYQHAKVSYNRLEEFLDIQEEQNGEIILKNINTIELNDLSFGYDEAKPLYASLNVNLSKGSIYCIKGKNGEGKSTLIDLILGINYDYDGFIAFNGIDITSIDMRHARKTLISTILQESKMQRISVRENLHRGLSNVRDKGVKDLLKLFNLNELLDLDDAQSLSGGEKQKVSVIRGFLKDSDVLILDEPISAMDVDGIRSIKTKLQSIKTNKIIVLISHNEELLDIVDEFIEIN